MRGIRGRECADELSDASPRAGRCRGLSGWCGDLRRAKSGRTWRAMAVLVHPQRNEESVGMGYRAPNADVSAALPGVQKARPLWCLHCTLQAQETTKTSTMVKLYRFQDLVVERK